MSVCLYFNFIWTCNTLMGLNAPIITIYKEINSFMSDYGRMESIVERQVLWEGHPFAATVEAGSKT